MTRIENVFSSDEIQELLHNSIVQTNKDTLSIQNVVTFSIPLSDTIKTILENKLGIHLSTTIPMRWIKGDIEPHIDTGESHFNYTHLIYLTDSVGNLIINGESYPIVAGDAHIFSEGLEHSTINTSNERLLIGPMSETGFPVGSTIYYYATEDDAKSNQNVIKYQGSGFIIETVNGISSWSIYNRLNNQSPDGIYSTGDELIAFGPYYLYPSSNAGAHGDPYITTFNGFKYKLPNILRTYRLLEYNDIVVNATVSELSIKEKEYMKQIGLQHNIKDMLYGFFFESFYIHSEHANVLFDRQLNNLEQHGEFECKNGKGTLHCPIQGISDYKSIIIQFNGVKISLRKYTNPQILNGIDISVTDVEKAKGLLNSLCNPKKYAIKKIKNVTPLHVTEEKIYKKDVKDIWVTKSY